MAVTKRRPQATATKERPTQDERQIAALIDKGGSVATIGAGEGSETRNVQLRLPVPFLEQIDANLATRRVRPSRHSWLLEAVIEKLDRESRAGTVDN